MFKLGSQYNIELYSRRVLLSINVVRFERKQRSGVFPFRRSIFEEDCRAQVTVMMVTFSGRRE